MATDYGSPQANALLGGVTASSSPAVSNAPTSNPSPTSGKDYGSAAANALLGGISSVKDPVASMVQNTKAPVDTGSLFPASSSTPSIKNSVPDAGILSNIKNSIYLTWNKVANTIDNVTARPAVGSKESTTTAGNFMSSLAETILPGVKAIRDNPDVASKVTPMDLVSNVPGAVGEVAQGLVHQIASYPLTFYGATSKLTHKYLGLDNAPGTDSEGNFSATIPGLGKFQNVQDRIKEDATINPPATGLWGGLQVAKYTGEELLNGLFTASLVSKVVNPRVTAITKNGVVGVPEGSVSNQAPKSFRLYEPQVYSKPVPPDAFDKIVADNKIQVNGSFNSKFPTFFEYSGISDNQAVGRFVQIRPSMLSEFFSKFGGDVSQIPKDGFIGVTGKVNNADTNPENTVDDLHPKLLEETKQHIQDHGPEITRQGLQDNVGLSEEQSKHVVDIAQKQIAQDNLSNPNLAESKMNEVMPSADNVIQSHLQEAETMLNDPDASASIKADPKGYLKEIKDDITRGLDSYGHGDEAKLIDKIPLTDKTTLESFKAQISNVLNGSELLSPSDEEIINKLVGVKVGEGLVPKESTTVENTSNNTNIPKKYKSAKELLTDKHPNLDIGLHENNNEITLSKIVVPKESRGQGLGTKAMEDLTKYADENNKRILLTPSKDYGASSVSRLVDFYKKFDFIENKGSSRDFSTREAMIREPQPKTENEPLIKDEKTTSTEQKTKPESEVKIAEPKTPTTEKTPIGAPDKPFTVGSEVNVKTLNGTVGKDSYTITKIYPDKVVSLKNSVTGKVKNVKLGSLQHVPETGKHLDIKVKDLGEKTTEEKKTVTINGEEKKRPEQLVSKTDLKNMLSGLGKNSVSMKIIERDGNKYMSFNEGDNTFTLRPSALGLVDDNMEVGDTLRISSEALKAKGSALGAFDRHNNQAGFISPGAMAESATKAVKEIHNIIKQSQEIGEINGKLSDAIYREEGANKALKQRLISFIQEHSADITPEEAENVYHRLEDPNYPLTPKEAGTPLTIAKELDKQLEQLRAEYRKLGGVITQDIMGEQTPRYAKEKGGVIDKLLDSVKQKKIPLVKQGGILTKSLGQGSKHRVFHIATDENGNRHVVSIKDGKITKFTNNTPTDLGSTEKIVNPKVKEFFDANVMPKLEKLAKDLGIKHTRVTKNLRPAGISYGDRPEIKTRVATPERVLLYEIGHQIDNKYNLQEFFKKDDDRNYGTDPSARELRALADLRIEGEPIASKSFKSYIRSGPEKMAAMFEAYLHVPEKFKAVAPNIFEKFEEFLNDHEELKPILDIKPSLTLKSQTLGGEMTAGMSGHTFIDNQGKQYTIGQATTKEIEQHTSTRYYKDFLTNYALAIERTSRATRALKFIEKVKNSPEFENIIAKEGEKEIPQGWKTTRLQQFRGYYFEPRIAEVLDDFAKRQEGGMYIPVYDEVNNFLISAIVLNPVMHFPNVAMGWASAEAGTGVAPLIGPKSRANFAKAFNAVKNKNEDYLTLLEEGAPLMDLKGTNKEFADELLKRLSNEVAEKPTQFQQIAKALNYANPLEWLKGISHFSEKATWSGNDVMFLHAIYDYADATEKTPRETIQAVSKRLADYRVPSRIGPGAFGRFISQLVQNNSLFMFSRFHYSGVVKPWIENTKDTFTGKDASEKWEGLRTLAFFAFMGLVVYPAINKWLKSITGDPNTYMSQSGAMRLPQNVIKLASGDSTPSQFIQTLLSLNPGAKIAVGLMTGYDPTFGTPIFGPGGEGVVPLATSQISPYQEARKITTGQGSWNDFFLSMGGVYTPKSSSAEKQRNAMVFQEKPQLLKSVKDHILAGDEAGATEIAKDFNVRLKATIKDALIENGKSGSDAQVQFVFEKDAIKMPGVKAMASYEAKNGKSFIDKVSADGQPVVKTNMPIQNDSIIHAVQVYAKAIIADPVTAFHDIFHGQVIRMVDNNTVIVYRMSLADSQKVKTDQGGNNPTMKLDHTLPLQLGGTNEEGNLKLVPTAVWASYTPVEDYLGNALKNETIDKATAQKLIMDFKAGLITFDDVKKQVGK